MRSIKFPDLFNSNSTNVWKSSEHLNATKQNTLLLLQTERNEVFGDPYFGLALKKYLFDQNDYMLKDAIIDLIYTQLSLFIPQIKIDRNNIEIIQDREKGKLYCYFSGVNQITYKIDNYSLLLFDDSEKIAMR